MADVLKRLAGPVILPTTSLTAYTVGAGVTTAVRNIHVVNISANPVAFSLNINAAANSTNGCLYSSYLVPVNGAFDWSGLLVLAAADYLAATASAVSSLVLTLSGVESS